MWTRSSVSTDGQRFDVGSNTAIFKLPQAAVKTVAGPSRDTTYSIKRLFNATVTSGSLTITTTVGLFEDVNDIIVAPQGGTAVKTSILGSKTGGGNGSTSVQYDCSASGLNLSDGVVCDVVATIKKTIAPKTKTPTTKTENIPVTNGNQLTYNLGKADVYELISLTDSGGVDQLPNFTLDNGQRDNFYDEAKLIKNTGTAPLPAGFLVAVFKYYSHGAGDYFCVDSYPTDDYGDIELFLEMAVILN